MSGLPAASRWRIAFRNLGRNRRRNLISGLAIAFAYAGLALMGAYIVRTEHYLRVATVYINHTGHLSIYKPGALENYLTHPNRYALTGDEQAKIESVLHTFPEVEFVGRYLLGVGLVGNGCLSVPFTATGIELATEARIARHPEVLRWTPELGPSADGRWIGDFATEVPDGISLTGSLASTLDKQKVWSEVAHPAKPVMTMPDCNTPAGRASVEQDADVQLVGRSFAGDFAAADARVVSHHRTGMAFAEDTGLIAPLPLLQKLYDTDRTTYLAVYLQPDVSATAFKTRLDERLKAAGLDVISYPFSDEKVGVFYVGVLNFLMTMATFFYVLVLGMIAVTLVNFITMGILERRREIGTLRAVGFQPRDIARLFFTESVVLTGISLACGIAFSFAVIFVVNRLGIHFRPPGIAGTMTFQLSPDFRLFSAAAVLVAVFSLITSFFTLRKRVGGNIAELLTS